MTKDQHDRLSKFVDSFNEAKSGYYRALLLSDVQEMNEIWVEMGNEKYEMTCSKCILTFLQQIGKQYFEYKEVPVQTETPKTEPKKTRKTNKK